jgi:hypothetical protein
MARVWKRGTGAGLSAVSIIPPKLHTHFWLHICSQQGKGLNHPTHKKSKVFRKLRRVSKEIAFPYFICLQKFYLYLSLKELIADYGVFVPLLTYLTTLLLAQIMQLPKAEWLTNFKGHGMKWLGLSLKYYHVRDLNLGPPPPVWRKTDRHSCSIFTFLDLYTGFHFRANCARIYVCGERM